MPQVASIDYVSKRIYLHFDTVSNGFDPVTAYKEIRALRRTTEADRKFRPLIAAQGNEPKGGGTFTPRRAVLLDGARFVPFDTSHRLRLLVEVITDDQKSGADAFDRLPLSSGVEVDIDIAYGQVEVITISTGSGLDAAQAAILTRLNSLIELNQDEQNRFTAVALEAAPAGVGGGSSASDIYTYFTSNSRENVFKADITSILSGLTEIKGATFNGTTDSLEAIRDRGDASWTTATGFSTHTAADVWAVGTRTVTGGTINTNLDMRGTDNALLAADYTEPPTIAAINAEMVDALSVDTYSEPTSVPPATATIAQKIGWLFALARNKITQSATAQTLRNDADSATIGTSAVSDDGATTTRGEWQ